MGSGGREYKFEKRPYGPDSSPAEVQAIQDRVRSYQPGILYWRELPVQSEFQLGLFERKLNELSRDLKSYDLLIDLIEAGPPGPAIRERLKRLFAGQAKLRRAAAFTGRNFMLNVAAKFVLGGSIGLKNFSVHKTLEGAADWLSHEERA